ncbi:MAG: hypothetical protein EOO91_21395 [Pedobacter sp.]|nr:MAG: hypothetical protein EOO91_21395 [Pedobacter sp.]
MASIAELKESIKKLVVEVDLLKRRHHQLSKEAISDKDEIIFQILALRQEIVATQKEVIARTAML